MYILKQILFSVPNKKVVQYEYPINLPENSRNKIKT